MAKLSRGKPSQVHRTIEICEKTFEKGNTVVSNNQ